MSTTSPTGMRRGTAHQKDFGDIVVDQSLKSLNLGPSGESKPKKRRVDTCSKGMSLFARKWMFEYIYIYTLPEANIAPENRAPQKETSIPTIHF